MTNNNLQKIIDIVHKLQEEMVANNVSGGQIAGTADAGDDPPVRKKHTLMVVEVQEKCGWHK